MRKLLLAVVFVSALTETYAHDNLKSAKKFSSFVVQPRTNNSFTLSIAQVQALNKIGELSQGLQQSSYYKNVSPDTFISQLTDRIINPYMLNQGKTLFCWAAAPVAYFYDQSPVNMVEAVFNLYASGTFRFFNGNEYLSLTPGNRSVCAVGSETFSKNSDPLSGKVVDQMVLLTFADSYKCWINIDHRFNPGDQRKAIWAGATLNKEKRVWRDFGINVKKHGSDMLWAKKNKADILKDAIDQNKAVVLYINAAYFNKKADKIRMMRRRPPFITTGSHYILVKGFEKKQDEYRITFWDDDGLQNYSISPDLFQRSVFGIVAFTKEGLAMNTTNETGMVD